MSAKRYLPMAAVILLLAACSQSGPQPVALATPLNQPSSTTATATRVPGTSATLTPGQQRVLDSNTSLSTALVRGQHRHRQGQGK